MFNINNFLSTILTAGGLGFSNFWILDRLGLINNQSINHNQQTIQYSLLFSIPDFAVFLFIQQLLIQFTSLNDDWLILLSLAITFVSVILITLFLGKCFHSTIYWIINKARVTNKKPTILNETPWQELENIGNGKNQIIYVYDFEHNPLGSGYVRTYSDSDNDKFSINLVPFDDNDMQKQLSYDEITKYIQSKDWKKQYHTYQHINFNQKFIVFILSPLSSEEQV